MNFFIVLGGLVFGAIGLLAVNRRIGSNDDSIGLDRPDSFSELNNNVGSANSLLPLDPAPQRDGDSDLNPYSIGIVGSNKSLPKGIRNNNGGNIKQTSDKWKGFSGVDPVPDTDGGGLLLRFIKAEWGIRAMAKVLINYQKRHGINTAHLITKRYATASHGYAEFIAKNLQIGIHEPFSIPDRIEELVRVMIKWENGGKTYPPQLIKLGVSLI